MDRTKLKSQDQFEDKIIEKVSAAGDSYTMTFDDHWSLFLDGKYGIVPKKGDKARVYGKGIGFQVRGLDINGKEAYYRTEQEQRELYQAEQRKQETQEQAEFELNQEEYDSRIAALPVAFWPRFNRFRRNNPKFRWKMEKYELMCAEQAVLIAKRLGTVEAIQKWVNLDYEDQKAQMPGLEEGHSGNSLGFACRLARLFIEKPEALEFEHGALCNLSGCEDYGCRPFTEDEQQRLEALMTPTA